VDGNDFLGMIGTAAEQGIYTSLLGVGLDFNADVVEAMSKAKGAWFGSIKTSAEFQKRLDDEFDYMVTPLVFNLRLHLSSSAYIIDKVFGSPESHLSTGQLMRVNTLFPSAKDEQGQTKGGVVLLRLVRKGTASINDSDDTIRLRVSYEDRCGIPDSSELCVRPVRRPLNSTSKDDNMFFENQGVRKAVLLARYASVLRHWLTCERESEPTTFGLGGVFQNQVQPSKECNMQTCTALNVSPQFKIVFEKLLEHFIKEMTMIEDDSLQQERAILEKLVALAKDGRNDTSLARDL
jgi:Ca-activated chloride channel family protein